MVRVSPKAVEKEHWINVFIHGSHGSFWGLLSFSKILKDQPEGTLYKKIQTTWRRHASIFCANRLMGNQGLAYVDASLGDQASMAFTLIKSYQTFVDMVKAPYEVHHCYTFGWSGLLSQTERRRAALRLYNELSAEIECYRKKGINPKIRIMAHSHGGGVAANLGAIYAWLHKLTACSEQELASVREMALVIEESEVKPSTTFFVDELHLYATPIQPETECFYFSPGIKLLINYYSDNDSIQTFDFFSTMSRKSRQKIDVSAYPYVSSSHIIQVKITVERPVVEVLSSKKGLDWVFTDLQRKIHVKAPMSGGKLICPHPKDPTHADFWCVEWNKKNTFIAPIPIIVLTPILLSILKKHAALTDVAINIHKGGNNALFSLCSVDLSEQYATYALPLEVVTRVKNELQRAKPMVTNFF